MHRLGIDNTCTELEQAENEGLVENLLSVQAIHLDADSEMRKLFGPGVVRTWTQKHSWRGIRTNNESLDPQRKA